MGGRTFAQINSGLLRSRKLAKCSHKERWAYICAHLTSQGSFLGLFRYPAVLWQMEAGLDPDEFSATILKLVSVGLIDLDPEEEIIRITGFLSQRPPDNASLAISHANDLLAFEAETEASERMLLATSAELCVAAVKRAQYWKPDSKDLPKLRDALKQFMRRMHLDHGDCFSIAVDREAKSAGDAVKGELCSLFPALELLHQTPCGHPADTVWTHKDEDEDETETNTKMKKKKDTNTGPISDFEDNPSSGLAELVDLQRKGESPNTHSSKAMPLASTRDSNLAKAARGG